MVAQRIKGDDAVDALAVWPFKRDGHLFAGQWDAHQVGAVVEFQLAGGAEQVGVGAQAQLLAGLFDLVGGHEYQFAIDDQAVAFAAAAGVQVDDVLFIHGETLDSIGPW